MFRRTIVGLRREHPERIWERRAPLTPDAVAELVHEKGAAVHVQPCTKRVFMDADYVKAGAQLTDTLAEADIVVGIKEPLLEDVIRGPQRPKTHFMFSHTIKGQSYNMPLLSKFLDQTPRMEGSDAPTLIDFELLTDETGKRTVGFGWFAGVAGVLESLSATAHSHLQLGIATPFLYTPRPHTLPSLDRLRAALREIGQMVATYGTPTALGPYVIGLTGNGNVSQGCLSILEELPIVRISVDDLPNLVKGGVADLRKIYLVHAQPQDYLVRKDGGAYSREDYYAAPQTYKSVFAEKVAPYLTLLLNGIGWGPEFPRLMSNEDLIIALEAARALNPLPVRGTNYGDISCDVQGGLQFTTEATTISSPTLIFNPNAPTPTVQYAAKPNSHLPPVTVMSVDILPASIPLDASKHFSTKFLPYLYAYLDRDKPRARLESAVRAVRTARQYEETGGQKGGVKLFSWAAEEELQREVRRWENVIGGDPIQRSIERATVAKGGELIGKHRWLKEGVEKVWAAKEGSKPVVEDSKAATATNTPKKKILLLGSGMVAQPAVDYIARRQDVELVIGSDSLKELQDLARPYTNVKYRIIDALKPDTYQHLIEEADVAISLLPAPFHPSIAQTCLRTGTHLITASYISPEMRRLDEQARKAGLLFLNELGLDPGLDHCSALELIQRLKSNPETAEITAFTSFCGGLPKWEDGSDVPLRYKFSWSPLGVLRAAKNSARYLLGGKMALVPGKELLRSAWRDVPVMTDLRTEDGSLMRFEGLPNRDSLDYLEMYGLGSQGAAAAKGAPSAAAGGFSRFVNPKDGKANRALHTFVRGTLRWPGFSALMSSFESLGLLEDQQKIYLDSWASFVPQAMVLKYTEQQNLSPQTVLPRIADIVDSGNVQSLVDALEWLGLVQGSPWLLNAISTSSARLAMDPNSAVEQARAAAMPPLPAQPQTPMEIFSYLLANKLKYAPHEQDMVVLSHQIVATGKEDNRKPATLFPTEKVYSSTLIAYGTDRPNVGFVGERPASAMARTVGIPLAIGALMIADEKLANLKGVHRPVVEEIYKPVLAEMAKVGLGFTENVGQVLDKGAARGKIVMMGEEAKSVQGDRKFGWTQVYRALQHGANQKVGGVRAGGPPPYDLDMDPNWREEDGLKA